MAPLACDPTALDRAGAAAKAIEAMTSTRNELCSIGDGVRVSANQAMRSFDEREASRTLGCECEAGRTLGAPASM